MSRIYEDDSLGKGFKNSEITEFISKQGHEAAVVEIRTGNWTLTGRIDSTPRPSQHRSVKEFLKNSPLEYLKLRLDKLWSSKTARPKIEQDIRTLIAMQYDQVKLYDVKKVLRDENISDSVKLEVLKEMFS